MSNAAKSMFAFGIYLVFLGTVMVGAPNPALALFGMPMTSEVWVRVVGMLLLFLAFFCIQAARAEVTDYFKWSIYTRSSVIIFFTAFVLLHLISPILILFGAIDLLGAIWTGLALHLSRTA